MLSVTVLQVISPSSPSIERYAAKGLLIKREWRQQKEKVKAEKLRKDALDEKKEQAMLKLRVQQEEKELNLLIESRKWPERVAGGVISWFWRYSTSDTKWMIRVICIFVVYVWPVYLVLWPYVSFKSGGEIRRQKRALRKAKAALEERH